MYELLSQASMFVFWSIPLFATASIFMTAVTYRVSKDAPQANDLISTLSNSAVSFVEILTKDLWLATGFLLVLFIGISYIKSKYE